MLSNLFHSLATSRWADTITQWQQANPCPSTSANYYQPLWGPHPGSSRFSEPPQSESFGGASHRSQTSASAITPRPRREQSRSASAAVELDPPSQVGPSNDCAMSEDPLSMPLEYVTPPPPESVPPPPQPRIQGQRRTQPPPAPPAPEAPPAPPAEMQVDEEGYTTITSKKKKG